MMRSLERLTCRFAEVATVTVISCVAMPTPASATPVVDLAISAADTEVSVLDGLPGATVTYGATSSGPTLSTPPMSVNHPGGTATVSGTVTYGRIDASASVSSPNQGDYTTAGFGGIWEDSLTVTSATLAAGTPVELHGALIYDIDSSCTGANIVQLQEIVAFNLGAPQISASETTCGTPLIGTQTIDVATWVGAILPLEGQLSIFVAVGQNSSAVIDPPTGFFVDPLTPGVSYVTGSGFSYLTPPPPPVSVSEPGTLTLLGFALACLAYRRPRRKSRSRS